MSVSTFHLRTKGKVALDNVCFEDLAAKSFERCDRPTARCALELDDGSTHAALTKPKTMILFAPGIL